MGQIVEVPDAIKQQKRLRTLLIFNSHRANMFENEIFGSLRLLPVMKLAGTGLESLPDSIGDLLHLRSLAGSRWGTGIWERKKTFDLPRKAIGVLRLGRGRRCLVYPDKKR